jgi:uncharacterized protein YfeS
MIFETASLRAFRKFGSFQGLLTMNASRSRMPGNRLELIGSGKTHRSYGGHVWSFAAEIIGEELPGFGDDLDAIYVTVFCNGRLENDHRGFPPLNDTESVKFYRKKKRMEISYPSLRFKPDEVFGLFLPQLERTHFSIAVDDLIDALSWGLKTRLTKKDNFDVAAFLAWIERFRKIDFASDDALRAAIQRAGEAGKARDEEKDPWERLDVDWDAVHPNARGILDDPLDWSCAYEFSPHGNDTGADILAEWVQYRSLSAHQAAFHIGWGDNEFDLENELFWSDWVKIHFALAFGQIKFSGTCSPALARDAKDVLETDIDNRSQLTTWPHRDEYLRKMNRYSGILDRFI